jgi:hypothetical protein
LNYLLVKKGYSLSDINNMETEEYDFTIDLIFEMNKQKKDTNLFGGL